MRFRQAGRLAIADEREIVDYTIIEDFDAGGIRELTGRVVELIKEGWQPLGRPFFAFSDPSFGLGSNAASGWYQAMVKYKADDIRSFKAEAESRQGE